MRKSLTLSFAAAAALLAGGAHAQSETPQAGPSRAEPRPAMTRADVEQRTAEMFGRMDANADGVLDQADRDARQRKAFDRVDADHDGSISFAEYEARDAHRREARAERGTARAEHRFGRRGGHGMARAADADSDGTITQAEFTTAALARFDRADANRDGTISAEERRGARHHHSRRGRAARDAG